MPDAADPPRPEDAPDAQADDADEAPVSQETPHEAGDENAQPV